jgi:hypothetical protein
MVGTFNYPSFLCATYRQKQMKGGSSGQCCSHAASDDAFSTGPLWDEEKENGKELMGLPLSSSKGKTPKLIVDVFHHQ